MEIKDRCFEGILEKPGVIPGKKTRVWCILDAAAKELIFCRENKRSSCISSEDLSTVTHVRQSGAKSGKEFEICGLGGRTITYTAESTESCEEWIKRISEVMKDVTQKQEERQQVEDPCTQSEREHTSVSDRIKTFLVGREKKEPTTVHKERRIPNKKLNNSQPLLYLHDRSQTKHQCTVREARLQKTDGKSKLLSKEQSSAVSSDQEVNSSYSTSALCNSNKMADNILKENLREDDRKENVLNNKDNRDKKTGSGYMGQLTNKSEHNTQGSEVPQRGEGPASGDQIDGQIQNINTSSEKDTDNNECMEEPVVMRNEFRQKSTDSDINLLENQAKPESKSHCKQEKHGDSLAEEEYEPVVLRRSNVQRSESVQSESRNNVDSVDEYEPVVLRRSNIQRSESVQSASRNNVDSVGKYEPIVLRRSNVQSSGSVQPELGNNVDSLAEEEYEPVVLRRSNVQRSESVQSESRNNVDNVDEYEPVVLQRSNVQRSESVQSESGDNVFHSVAADEPVVLRRSNVHRSRSVQSESDNTPNVDSLRETEYKPVKLLGSNVQRSRSVQSELHACMDDKTESDSGSEAQDDVDSGQTMDGLLSEEQENLLYSLVFDPIPQLPHSSSNIDNLSCGDDELIDLVGNNLNLVTKRAPSSSSIDLIEQLRNLLKPVQ